LAKSLLAEVAHGRDLSPRASTVDPFDSWKILLTPPAFASYFLPWIGKDLERCSGFRSPGIAYRRWSGEESPAERRSLFIMLASISLTSAAPVRRFGWMGATHGWCFVLSGLWLISAGWAQEFDWSGPGFVLLQNGNVLQGSEVRSQGKSVVIRLDQTGEVSVPATQIVTIGTDVSALYQHQWNAMRRWEPGDHFQLAKWCIRNGLIEEAYAHYLQLKESSGAHSKFKQFESELRQSLLQDPSMQAALRAAAPPASQRDQVVPALAEKALTTVSPELSQPAPAAFVGGSKASQDYFRRQIQPFLAMRCGQAGCHGAYGQNDFHVARSGSLLGRPAHEISYESALKCIDGGPIEQTILWNKATTKHGTQVMAGLDAKITAELALLERLRAWHRTWHTGGSAAPVTAAVHTMPPLIVSPPSPHRVAAQRPPRAASPTSEQPILASHVEEEGQGSPIVSDPYHLPDVGHELLWLEREIAKLEKIESSRRAPAANRHDPEEYHRLYLNPLRVPSSTEAEPAPHP